MSSGDRSAGHAIRDAIEFDASPAITFSITRSRGMSVDHDSPDNKHPETSRSTDSRLNLGRGMKSVESLLLPAELSQVLRRE